jgi:ABC-type Co2+ transport system permease subunit
MKLASVFGITIVVVLMTLYEWPKINREQKKEKVAFVSLSGAGWFLAVLLVYYPDIPGPTDLIDMIFRPLGRVLEN